MPIESTLRAAARLLLMLSLVGLSNLAACGSDDDPGTAGADVASNDTGGSGDLPTVDTSAADTTVGADSTTIDSSTDLGTDTPVDTGANIDSGDLGGPDLVDMTMVSPHVQTDLAAFLSGAPDPEDTVRVFRAASSEDLLGGVSAQGRVGDYVLENGRARFIVEDAYRAMYPCPFGGNVIDAAAARPDGSWVIDQVGEVCPLVNGGLTLMPEEYEILSDGSDGVGVLAVTGSLEVLDFLNLEYMVGYYISADINFTVDPDRIPPLRMTQYFILRPGDDAVRIITAVRNDSDEREYMGMGHLLLPGGLARPFNPLNPYGGYGFETLGGDDLSTAPVAFQAYGHDEASFAYVPKPDPGLSAAVPVGGGSLSINGATAVLLGTTNILLLVIAPESSLDRVDGSYSLDPDEVITFEHSIVVGNGGLSSVLDSAYEIIGAEAGTLSGRLLEANGDGVAGVRVTAIDEANRAMNQSVTDTDGRYAMNVPPGTYTVSARTKGRYLVLEEALAIEADGTLSDVDGTLPAAALLTIQIEDETGSPTPGRVSILCVDGCPNPPTSREEDVIGDRLPGGFSDVLFADLSGVVEIPLHPGSYRVVVSRGLEWSLWPPDTRSTGGYLVEVEAGDTLTLEAEIAHVLDTEGALSGDFHIHAVASTDSQVSNHIRVLNYLGEGVDVMVSTDHDFIVDFGPVITEMGAGAEIASVVGAEITTPEFGHFNGFPLPHDTEDRFGGAYDWGNGTAPASPPRDIYAWVHDHDGEQVMQLNHPGGTGTIHALGADVLLGTTTTEPAVLRIAPQEDTRDALDTGLWSDDFTALELMNGSSRARLHRNMRWWFTMIGRGFTPTATAVTDTHRLYGDLGGVPRSYVFVGADEDDTSTFDDQAFARAINSGQVVGTNGPYFEVFLENSDGVMAALGETLASGGQEVTATLDIQVPEWMQVDTVDVYMNITEGIYSPDGEEIYDFLPPTMTIPITLTVDDLETIATGIHEHKRYRTEVSIVLPGDVDAYVVFVVYDAEGSQDHMYPIVPSTGTKPTAWSNPIFIDADGGGYDSLPLADLIEEITDLRDDRLMTLESMETQNLTLLREQGLWPLDGPADRPRGPFEVERVHEFIEATSCQH